MPPAQGRAGSPPPQLKTICINSIRRTRAAPGRGRFPPPAPQSGSRGVASACVLGADGRARRALLAPSPDLRGASGGVIYSKFAFVLTLTLKVRCGQTDSALQASDSGSQAWQVGAAGGERRSGARATSVPCVGAAGAGRVACRSA